MTGFEPATPRTPCVCATRLRHIPKFGLQIYPFYFLYKQNLVSFEKEFAMKNLSIFFSIPIIAISCQNPNNKTEIALKEPAARGYSIEKVVDNLNNPWGMDWLPDGSSSVIRCVDS